MQLFGAVVLHAGQIEVLQNVQNLHDDGAAGRRGRRGDDLIAPVGALDGLQHLYLVVGHVLHGEQAAVLVHRVHDGLGHLALVEAVPAFGDDLLHQLGVFRILKDLAHLVGHLHAVDVLQEQIPRFGIQQHGVVAVHHVAVQGGGYGEPRPGQVGHRTQHLFPAHGAVVFQGVQHAGYLAGNARGLAAQGLLAADHRGIAVGVGVGLPHLRRGRRGGALPEIDEHGLPRAGQAQRHKAAAAHAGGVGLGKAQGKAHGYRRVDGVAPRLQNLNANLGGFVFSGSHHRLGSSGATAGAQDHAVLIPQLEVVQGGIALLGVARQWAQGHEQNQDKCQQGFVESLHDLQSLLLRR